jgi:hypothetical protein
MSGWGTVIFELGFGGVLFLGSFIALMSFGISRLDRATRNLYVCSLVTIYFTMLMAVPIAFPLFGYTLGIFAFLKTPGVIPAATPLRSPVGSASVLQAN